MKKRIKNIVTLFLSLIISITFSTAKEIKGRILDEKSIILQNVSISLKNDRSVSTFTNENGEFVISLEGANYTKKDSIIFSHIGYETKGYQIKELNDSLYHEIILIESSVILEDVNVAMQKKLSRKELKNHKISILEQFKKQLSKDFVVEDKTYNVSSMIELFSNTEKLLLHKIIGEYKEIIGGRLDKTDSISLTCTDIEFYMNNDMKLDIKEMSDIFINNDVVSKKRKKNKQILDSTFYTTLLNDSVTIKQMLITHNNTWSSSRSVEENILLLNYNPNKWEIIEESKQTVLRYKDKIGVLGILKHSMIIDFIVDPISYSLERSYGKTYAELNIPFGYKLPSDVLMLLNVINDSSGQMEKYRMRHLHINGTNNIIYKKIDDRKYVDEIDYNFAMSLIDTKKRNVKGKFKLAIKVLSIRDNYPFANTPS